jgi:purine nucleosidase
MPFMAKHKVIFDTDPGIDDAMALLFIHLHESLDLLGITTCLGNADIETTTRNALYLKQRFAISAPVAKGAAVPLKGPTTRPAPKHIHGDNGLGNVPLPEKITAIADPRPAWQLIVDTVRAHPNEVTLIAVGRMTNLALALQHDPGITKLVKSVSIMGGAFGGHGHFGNVTPVAEANIHGDPDAADIVMTAPWPVTVVGLDVTHETVMTPAYLRQLGDEGGEWGAFMWDISRHYEKFYRDAMGHEGIACHDSLAVAYVTDPDIFQLRRGPVRVVTDGIAIGQTIQHHRERRPAEGPWQNHPAQNVAVGIDSAKFLDLYLDTFRKAAASHKR